MPSRRSVVQLGSGLGIFAIGGAGWAEPAGQAELGPSIAAAMQAWIGARHAAGVSVGVAQSGRVAFSGGAGFAGLEPRDPARADTVYRVGSVQKQFTAAALLRLCDAGEARLDDPLSRYLPRFPRAAEVTLGQLLNHTSGLHNYTEAEGVLAEIPFLYDHSTADWVSHIARQRPLYDFAPGTRWKYSNSGFYLAGAVVEKVSGMSFARFLALHICRPLGLRDTAVDSNPWSLAGALHRPQDPRLRRARGYERDPASAAGFRAANYVPMSVAGAAGALRSTALDLLAWHAALFGGRVLSPSSLQAMTTPSRLRDGRLTSQGRVASSDEPPGEYGLGLRIATFHGRRRLGHEGDIDGFDAVVNTYPDDALCVAVLANTPGGSMALEEQIAEIALRANKGKTS